MLGCSELVKAVDLPLSQEGRDHRQAKATGDSQRDYYSTIAEHTGH